MGSKGSRLPSLVGLVLVAVLATACNRAQSADAAARSNFLFSEIFGERLSTDKALLSEARELWEELAKEGDPKAQYYLSFLYLGGLAGVQPDEATGVRLTENSAHAGYTQAQAALANWYEHGVYVKKDESLAVEWWIRAAANGDRLAQSRLERAYTLGEIGLPVDPQEAQRWREAPKNRGE
jgi:TPR repeat protein